jgi:hypothetical protein
MKTVGKGCTAYLASGERCSEAIYTITTASLPGTWQVMNTCHPPKKISIVLFDAGLPVASHSDLDEIFDPRVVRELIVTSPDPFEQARLALADIDSSVGSSRADDVRFAAELATQALNRFSRVNLVPDRVLKGGDDVALYFFSKDLLDGGGHRRYARLGLSEDGVTLTLEDRVTGSLCVEEIHADNAALDQVAAHIQGFLS